MIDTKELRKAAGQIADSGHAGWGNAMSDAADTIEAQAAEIERLRELLEACTTEEGPTQDELNRARAAIAKEKTS